MYDLPIENPYLPANHQFVDDIEDLGEEVISMAKVIDLKSKYDATCYLCGHVNFVKPSINMTHFKINMSGTHCNGCGKWIGLQIDINNERMISYPYGTQRVDAKMPEACYRELEED